MRRRQHDPLDEHAQDLAGLASSHGTSVFAFGLTSDATYYRNGVLARGPRAQLVPVLRDAATAYVATGQEPRPIAHDPAPPLDGLWWLFRPERGAWTGVPSDACLHLGGGVVLEHRETGLFAAQG